MDAVNDQGPGLDASRWAARLDLHFALREGRTKLSHVEHYGPLRVQRPFYPEENGTAHVYILHPPGGVVGGDLLETRVEAGERSRALLTTPAATKLYRSSGAPCGVHQSMTVCDGGIVEWLPQETIVFSGARAQLSTIVHLEETAEFIGWESICLGRPASGDEFESGCVTQRCEIWRGDEPLLVERLVVEADGELRGAPWGLDGNCVVSTMWVTTTDSGLVDSVREVLSSLSPNAGRFACTAPHGLISVRYVGPSVPECTAGFVRVWEKLRPVLSGRVAGAPRIWSC